MAREFTRAEISEVPVANGLPPDNDAFRRLLAGAFADWRLAIDGMVGSPASFSLAELKSFPSSTQITHLACEEGWSYIAEWTGVRLSHLLNLVAASPQAKYAVYFSIDEWWRDSIDMSEALHPQTLVTYGMNGRDLPTGHGAPVRLRVPRQLGYKSVKHLARITLTDDIKKFGKGLGSVAADFAGYSWYAGI
jgi:DMSO/TMAO reductase YedYZ molybdopterin-dependent catalytic subunit